MKTNDEVLKKEEVKISEVKFDAIDENGNEHVEVEIIVIDIALYSHEGKPVPRGHHYKIMVDQKSYIVKQESLTGREILTLAGKNPPERYQLNQRFKEGKVQRVNYDQEVNFTAPGIEKFMTIPLDQTEG
jgi:hypothetical protein